MPGVFTHSETCSRLAAASPEKQWPTRRGHTSALIASNPPDSSRYARKTQKKCHLPRPPPASPPPPFELTAETRPTLLLRKRFFRPLRTKTEAGAPCRARCKPSSNTRFPPWPRRGGGPTPTAPSPDPRPPPSGPHPTMAPPGVAEEGRILLWRKDSLKIGPAEK